MEIIDGGDLRGFANIHPKTAKKLDADIGSIVIFEDPQSSFWGAAEIRKSKDVAEDQIVIDTLVLEASLLMEGDQVELTLYHEDMIALEYIEFGLKPLAEDANTEDLVSRAAERVNANPSNTSIDQWSAYSATGDPLRMPVAARARL